MFGKTTAADSEPPEKKEKTQQAGIPTTLSAAVCSETGQGGAGGRREAGGQILGRSPLRLGVPAARSALAASTTEDSLLRARSTAQWNSLCGESGAERSSPTLEKTSSTSASAQLCSEDTVAAVGAVGAGFSEPGETAADCRGVETEARPFESFSGSGRLEDDPSPLSSCPDTVN